MGDKPDYEAYYRCLERLEVSRRLFPAGPTVLDVVYVAETYEEFLDWTDIKFGTDLTDVEDIVKVLDWPNLLKFLETASV